MERSCPQLRDAIALLRIVRRSSDVDGEFLSQSAILLQDLRGEPGPDGSTPRGLSAFMLCNQSPETIGAIAETLSLEPDLRENPRGAAARSKAIEAMDHQGVAIFEIVPEPSTTGHPGHVAIRFARGVRNREKALQRRFRDRLIETFGDVSLVAELRRTRCETATEEP